MPIKPVMLKQYLFGDFKYKDGKVGKWKQNEEALPIFAKLALQLLWDIHEYVAASSAANLAVFLLESSKMRCLVVWKSY
jgi:hypothetical protein